MVYRTSETLFDSDPHREIRTVKARLKANSVVRGKKNDGYAFSVAESSRILKLHSGATRLSQTAVYEFGRVLEYMTVHLVDAVERTNVKHRKNSRQLVSEAVVKKAILSDPLLSFVNRSLPVPAVDPKSSVRDAKDEGIIPSRLYVVNGKAPTSGEHKRLYHESLAFEKTGVLPERFHRSRMQHKLSKMTEPPKHKRKKAASSHKKKSRKKRKKKKASVKGTAAGDVKDAKVEMKEEEEAGEDKEEVVGEVVEVVVGDAGGMGEWLAGGDEEKKPDHDEGSW